MKTTKHAERLRQWADNLNTYRTDIGHWGSRGRDDNGIWLKRQEQEKIVDTWIRDAEHKKGIS